MIKKIFTLIGFLLLAGSTLFAKELAAPKKKVLIPPPLLPGAFGVPKLSLNS